MSNHTVKRIADMEAIFHGSFRRAGDELEIGSFGMNVFDLPPDTGDRYPEHDHSGDGQEEVYVVLRGSGTMVVDGEEIALAPETIVRVGPAGTRKISSGPEGLRILALGGIPGAVYERPEMFKKGTPDPTAA